ncbi:MAG: hypothetical protein V4666_08260 [Bacteroidota bacterium]
MEDYNKDGTVTISLEKFEAMKAEIKQLKIDNQQKTIYKEYLPEIYGKVILVIALIFVLLRIYG